MIEINRPSLIYYGLFKSSFPFKQAHNAILQTNFCIGETIYEQVFSNSNNQQTHYKINKSLVKTR